MSCSPSSPISRSPPRRGCRRVPVPAAPEPADGVEPAPCRPAALDLTRLKMFEDMLPLDEIRALLDMYLINTNERLATICTLSEGGDLALLTREAHTLIGTSGNVGA